MGRARKMRQRGSYQIDQMGFKGLLGSVEDELLPDGYISEVKNLELDKTQGLLKSIRNPTEVNSVKDTDVWTSGTAIALNTIVLPTTSDTHFYICTVAGTTGATEPTWSKTTGTTTTDNTVTWTEAGLITDAVKAIFLWEKDDGTKTLLAQIGTRSVCDLTNSLGHIFSAGTISDYIHMI